MILLVLDVFQEGIGLDENAEDFNKHFLVQACVDERISLNDIVFGSLPANEELIVAGN